MTKASSVLSEISYLTSEMIGVGLCEAFNYPSQKPYRGNAGRVVEVSFSGYGDTPSALRNQPYQETYQTMKDNGSYNMLLIDGALIQFRYLFQRRKLLKHMLAFYPSPFLLDYENHHEAYQNNLLYADAIAQNIVNAPIRFDYDDGNFEEYVHPKSHFTIGQYQNCRIPVKGGLTPYRFLNIILRSFYSQAYFKLCTSWKKKVNDFGDTITTKEKGDMHWSFD